METITKVQLTYPLSSVSVKSNTFTSSANKVLAAKIKENKILKKSFIKFKKNS